MGRAGDLQHQAEVLRAADELSKEGRVILCGEKLPHILAVKGDLIYGFAPIHQRPEQRPGKGAWRSKATPSNLRKKWPHLDGVHVYRVRPEESDRDAVQVHLLRNGWRFIEANGKCPDALLVKAGGKVVAVEVLGKSQGKAGWTQAQKRNDYSMFDAVTLRVYERHR